MTFGPVEHLILPDKTRLLVQSSTKICENVSYLIKLPEKLRFKTNYVP